MAQAVAGAVPVILDTDLLLNEHREWGLSCYDRHGDGSGVAIASAHRPLLNMRADHRYHVGAWQLPADVQIVTWLAGQQVAFDVVTDEQLHAEGLGLLAPYRVVVTGTHPEYYSTAMLDAIDRWIDDGGRLVYSGANGFYWRIAFDTEQTGVIELRRGQAGSRAWESAPGECHLARTGELGGLWRHLGRPPQRLFGVGYAAQGFDVSGWFERCPDSHDPRAAFVFDGVDEQRFGTSGSIGGGAAGQELDRYDRALGTPHDALLLATSAGLSEGYLRCVEELGFNVPGTSAIVDPQARGDVVYFVRPSGGAVFATGSIAWAGALASDAAVSRITRNVIDRFADPTPLPW
jgi:N,N-dimethylformamidase